MGIKSWITEKLNPAQGEMSNYEKTRSRSNTKPLSTGRAYRDVEVVNRGVNMLVDSMSLVDYSVGEKHKFTPISAVSAPNGVRKTNLEELLNVRPNPYMDISSFRRLCAMDFVMEGWAFIHWDGTSLYHLPAAHMEVVADSKQYISKFVFNGEVEYKPHEIIFIKDNAYAGNSINEMGGQSRMFSCMGSVEARNALVKFKSNFFKNGAMVSLIIETDAVISKRIRKRLEEEISIEYNPETGKSPVMLLDAGLKAKSITPTSTKDIDVDSDIEAKENAILKGLGVPAILLDSGNNANLRPNIDLFYHMTVIPAQRKFLSAFELFFAYKLKLDLDNVSALAPDKKLEAEAVTSKVNNGIITADEGREELRYKPLGTAEMTEIRIPANISGSATGVSGQEGGAPTQDDSTEDS